MDITTFGVTGPRWPVSATFIAIACWAYARGNKARF
jgi:hypothetical protein